MRVCLLHSCYWPVFAGSAIHSHLMAQLMLAKGYEAWVLTPRYPGLPAQEIVDGVRVIRAPILGSRRIHHQLCFMFSAAVALIRQRGFFDVLHMHNFSAFDTVLVLVAKVLGKSVLYQMNLLGAEPQAVLRGRGRLISFWGLRMVDGFIALSTPLQSAFAASRFADRLFALLPLGVDTSVYHPALPADRDRLRVSLGLDKDVTYICFVGSIIERKGVDVLVEAFAQIAAHRRDAKLLLVGEDKFISQGFMDSGYRRAQSFANSLKERIAAMGLRAHVLFTGLTDRVADYLRASDIFVFPSRREGLGVAILEAMAVGLPCIVAELDGVALDLIHNGIDGYVVKGHDPQQYAERITELLENPQQAQRLGQNARVTILTRFRFEDATRRYLAFYHSLLGKELETCK